MSKEEKSTEIIPTNLAAVITDQAISALARQRESLNVFIKTQLKEDSDYGVIPGTPKPTLLQPGAQKLANIFQLSNRIVNAETQIDHERKFIMCTYIMELIHIPSGKVIAQCQGSTNSLERKYSRQDPFGLINTLQKMAQKRAFIGAVVQATNASDFFTQDIEDMDIASKFKNQEETTHTPSGLTSADLNDNTVIRWGKYKGKTMAEAASDERFRSYCDWVISQSEGKKDKKGFLNDAVTWRQWLDAEADENTDLEKAGEAGVSDAAREPGEEG